MTQITSTEKRNTFNQINFLLFNCTFECVVSGHWSKGNCKGTCEYSRHGRWKVVQVGTCPDLA